MDRSLREKEKMREREGRRGRRKREERGEGGAALTDGSRGGAADGGLSGCATTPRSSCAAQPSPRRLNRRFPSQLGPLLPLPRRPTECFKIDLMIHYRFAFGTNLDGNGDFMVDYDYLVLALGVTVNTFNTPSMMEHCHFLKVVEDAQKIRKSVIDCFEKASLPNLSEEEKRKILHFVIIGGGPTGVEFAVELHDFLVEDLVKLYPAIEENSQLLLALRLFLLSISQ
ncbi:hypothetical protein CFC21_040078 [Triticum aestivum]|uniref:FAD/NAD(P)-binding domain-containing protein n=2 Tax=Triticum aestivum TaxID=4565 RepID=A0A9R1FFV3_WHEAT|nr:hypothetical protein CFC21_040078 [Triticum aestivum]CDM81487.1 unnamed protein product [Triticum aestivum]